MSEAEYKEMKVSAGLFNLGRCVITPGAQDALKSIDVEPRNLLSRHQNGDWSQMCGHDQNENRKAVKNGFRVFSFYKLANGIDAYVITEADRSATTILLPGEY